MWKLILLLENLRKNIQLFIVSFTGYEMFLPMIFDWIF